MHGSFATQRSEFATVHAWHVIVDDPQVDRFAGGRGEVQRLKHMAPSEAV